jgi:rubrerythrin
VFRPWSAPRPRPSRSAGHRPDGSRPFCGAGSPVPDAAHPATVDSTGDAGYIRRGRAGRLACGSRRARGAARQPPDAVAPAPLRDLDAPWPLTDVRFQEDPMSDAKKQRMIEAIKKAVMVEIKGQQLYSHAVETTKDPAARAMFEALARDEEDHVRILQAQFKSLLEDGKLDLDAVHPAEVDHGSHVVIDDAFKKSLKRGTFEMAVIGIGCDLENKAIAYYKEQAAAAEDPALKTLFTWLVEWEDGHLEQLLELEKYYQDAYWADQGFSPM